MQSQSQKSSNSNVVPWLTNPINKNQSRIYHALNQQGAKILKFLPSFTSSAVGSLHPPN